MSRMLNVVRESSVGRGMSAAVAAAPEPTLDAFESMPFIEIGGPNGPVSSWLPVSAPKPVPAPAPKPAVVAETVPFPRLAVPEAPFVSVAFHDVAAIPKAPPRADGPTPDLVAFHYPDHPVSVEYRALRDEIRHQLPENVPHALLFTAAAPNAGTTTVVLNLAATLAREGKARVLVVDANLGRPTISARLGVKDSPGLAESLAGKLPLAWAIQAASVPNLQVLSAGIANSGTATALTEELPKLLAQLRQWFDWVLIDGGVWGEMPERDAACPGADAVYLVTREAHAARKEFDGLRGWVRELGGLLRGFITTRA